MIKFGLTYCSRLFRLNFLSFLVHGSHGQGSVELVRFLKWYRRNTNVVEKNINVKITTKKNG